MTLPGEKEGGTMATMACVLPILPGRQEAWRRFWQVLQGSRRDEYEEFQRRLGITKELVWLQQTLQGDMVIVYLEMEQPDRVLPQLAASDFPFDCWFRQQLLELHGLDATQLTSGPASELVFVWQMPQVSHKGGHLMSTEENKAIVQRFLDEVMSAGNITAADNVCAVNLVWHGGSVGEVPNLESFKQLLSAFFTAFPDFHFTDEEITAEGEKVAARYTWSGTQRGEFQGIPPTGKQVKVAGMSIYRIAGGKIAEEWWQEDLVGLMQQLGAIPSMG
jgi:steroid delta-isomerase-like uncharacterized protein